MKTITCTTLLGLALIGFRCVPFSDMQSARLVGKGKFEATPGFSSVSLHYKGDNARIQNEFGVQLAYGISEKVDFRFRYENVGIKGDYLENFQAISFGPKFSLVKDNMAFYAPVGFAPGEGNSWQFQPTLLFTAPLVKSKLDFNPALKVIIPFSEGSEALVAFNAGFAISKDVTKWAIRPEYGWLFNPGESGYYSHFSVGLSINFSNLAKQKQN